MPRRGERRAKPVVGDPNDPEGLVVWKARHLTRMRVRNYSEQTIEGREDHLRRFIVWCDERGLGRPGEITKPMLERYQRYLVTAPARGGKPMSFRSQYVRLGHIKGYFKWLTRQNVIGGNPAGELEMPRREHRLPAHVLTVSEVETVMASIDLRTPKGLRDRAIVEVLYATGMLFR